MKSAIVFCRKIFFLSVVCLLSQVYVKAQTVSHLDTTFGQGTFNSFVQVMAFQSDGKVIVGGEFTYYKTTPVHRLARLNTDGTLDKTFQAPDDNYDGYSSVTALAIQPDGKIIVARKIGNYTNDKFLIRLNQDGTIDPTFSMGIGFSVDVKFIQLQADEKIILGGNIYNIYPGMQSNVVRLTKDGALDNTFSLGANKGGSYVGCTIDANGKIIVVGDKLRRLNTDGSLDVSFDISGTGPTNGASGYGSINSIACQQNGKYIITGDFDTYNGTAQNTVARINEDGTLDNSFIGNTMSSNGYPTLSKIQPDGKIIIGGSFYNYNGTGIQNLTRLNADGSLDADFNKDGENPDYLVTSVLLQADGKIIIGGYFTMYNDIMTTCIARLNTDGSLEASYNPCGGSSTAFVRTMALQSDGKILIAGEYNYSPRNHNPFDKGVSRRNADGTRDETFKAPICDTIRVQKIALQPDGKIIIAGVDITRRDFQSHYVIARLLPDGTRDLSFKPIWNMLNGGSGGFDAINSIACQADGKILIGGYFTSIDGFSINNFARLNSDGSLDNTFAANAGSTSTINSITVQADQKILVVGYFTNFNGKAAKYIVRLNADGTTDNSFVTPGTGLASLPSTVALQPDGKIILAGNQYFNSFNGITRKFILRLNADGTLDNGFNCTVPFDTESSTTFCLLQADGKMIIGGGLTYANGTSDYRVFRLNTDGSLDDIFAGVGCDGIVFAGVLQDNGGIVLGGFFRKYRNFAYTNIVRLIGDPADYNSIRGKIYTDANADCKKQTSETPLSSLVVKAMPGAYYGNTDQYGNYEVRVGTGTVSYTLTQQFNAVNTTLLTNQCAPSHTVPLRGASKDTASFDFANDVKACIFPTVAIQHTQLIRCFKSQAYIQYCNVGNVPINNASITVEYPPYLIPVSSTPMWTSKNGSTLTYDLGVLQEVSCGNITIIDSVDCAPINLLGLTQCIKVTISPNSTCTAQNVLWDLSSTEVRGSCTNNQTAFVISNTGDGNMADSLAYRVFVNDTLVYNGKYKLVSGNKLDITYPSAGQTVRLEADQHPNHPGHSTPRAVVESCGVSSTGRVYTGLITTTALDDQDDEVAMVCYPIRGSYDPNDKQAVPTGVGPTKKVAPGTELEYTIRFQNTGTAPAYTVKVVDTLDADLDVTSLLLGVSSHAYTLKVTGKGQAVLTFTFNNINLPDSTADKLGSNGLLSFKITIPSDATLGTVIDNKAYIYFDYNDAIITNNTTHTVGVDVVENLSKGSLVHVSNATTGILYSQYKSSVKVYPNPSEGMVTLEMVEPSSNMELRVTSIVGVLQKTIKLSNTSKQQVSLEGIRQGMYLYEIWKDGERNSVGTLQIW